MSGRAPYRRLLAFGIDYLVIALWLAGLTAIAFVLEAPERLSLATPGGRIIAHLTMFAAVTAPIMVSFAALEASPLHGTIGKRLTGLRVMREGGGWPGCRRTLIRNVLKFLPWEAAHTAIWYAPGQPFVDPPAAWNLAVWAGALALALIYAASLFFGAGRTPYDRMAGVRVERKALQTVHETPGVA